MRDKRSSWEEAALFICILALLTLSGCGLVPAYLGPAYQVCLSTGESPITSGIILSLDAATASSSAQPYPSGCAPTSLTWTDLSANALNGTLTNFSASHCSGAVQDGWHGDGSAANPYALKLDGIDDHVEIADAPAMRLGTGPFSVGVWFKKVDVGWQSLFNWKAGPGDFGIYMFDEQFYFFMSPTFTSVPGAETISLGQWHYGLVERDSSQNVSTYLDGALYGTPATSSFDFSSITAGTALWLGSNHDTSFNPTLQFDGWVAIYQYYNRSLSDSEIQQNCRASQMRFTTGGCVCAP